MTKEFKYPITEYTVIDGDTIRCMLDMGFGIYKRVDVRITDINTPEVRGSEKVAGIPVAEVLKIWLSRYDIEDMEVLSIERGKYAGRIIGDLLVKNVFGETVSSFLRSAGLAQAYGSPKFTEHELIDIKEYAEKLIEESKQC